VLGVPIPFHINFEEVNLRFYTKRVMKDETRRAVCFVKEIVPRWAIATVARVVYSEPYECWQMSHERTDTTVAYDWTKNGSRRGGGGGGEKKRGGPETGGNGEFTIGHLWG